MAAPWHSHKRKTPAELTDDQMWEARRRCQGNLCPWCILDARHGYLHEAQIKATSLVTEMPDDAPKEALWIAMHAQRWCEKICEQYPREAPAAWSAFSGQAGAGTGSGASSASWFPPPPPPAVPPLSMRSRTSPTAWLSGPSDSQTAGTPTGPAGSRPAAPDPVLRLDENGVPLPGFLDGDWVFECWTGKKYKWVAYEEPTQVQLRRAYNNHEGVQNVMVLGTEMQVSVTPGDMYQDNPNTGAPARKVQIAPVGGWPE